MSLAADRFVTLPLPPMKVQPVTLTGREVRLEPLSPSHFEDLCRVGLDEALWHFSPTPVHTRAEMQAYLATALQCQAEGTALPFAICLAATGQAIGSTRFGNIDLANRRLEIGWT